LPGLAESIAKCLAEDGNLVDGVWKMDTERVSKFIINDFKSKVYASYDWCLICRRFL
jgi:hypothetical protein